MQHRPLGQSGIEIAPIVFGGNVFGWTVDEKTCFELLDYFVDQGFNAIDTADTYSTWIPGNQGGESETMIGKWLKSRGHRDKVMIATKVGNEMAPGRKGLSRKHILSSVEDSLKRLQIETIDLYQAHIDDQDTPLEETLMAFEDLIQSGKVRAIGASNYSASRLQEAERISESKGYHRYESLQPPYNLFDRQTFEQGLQSYCREHRVGVITFYSLASGFLSGKYRSEADLNKSPRGQSVKNQYFNERGREILKALDQVAEDTASTPTQVALAWVLHQPGVTAPIVSATSLDQLQEILKTPEIQLSETHLDLLGRASAYSS